MRSPLYKVVKIESPIQIEIELNHWVEKDKVTILDTTTFTYDNKQYLLVTYSKNAFCNF